MARPTAPSMPTAKQIRDTHDLMKQLYPDVKIYRIGPDGVTFAHGDQKNHWDWNGVPFTAEAQHE